MATLADPSRFQMFCELADGPRHVSDLARLVGLSQSCATRHVQVLARAGCVECRRAGKRVMVSLQADEEVTRSLLGWITGSSMRPTSPAVSASVRTPGAPKPARRSRRPAVVHGEEGSGQEVSPAETVASGTSSGHPNHPQPSAPSRSRALEDFLL